MQVQSSCLVHCLCSRRPHACPLCSAPQPPRLECTHPASSPSRRGTAFLQQARCLSLGPPRALSNLPQHMSALFGICRCPSHAARRAAAGAHAEIIAHAASLVCADVLPRLNPTAAAASRWLSRLWQAQRGRLDAAKPRTFCPCSCQVHDKSYRSSRLTRQYARNTVLICKPSMQCSAHCGMNMPE